MRRLQTQQIGPYQKRLENLELDAADMGANNFSHGRPLCVQMNDFTSDAKIWTVNLQSQ